MWAKGITESRLPVTSSRGVGQEVEAFGAVEALAGNVQDSTDGVGESAACAVVGDLRWDTMGIVSASRRPNCVTQLGVIAAATRRASAAPGMVAARNAKVTSWPRPPLATSARRWVSSGKILRRTS